MKGKYAAQAKNRLANLDNELLQEVVAERDTVRSERDRLAQELKELQRDLHAKAMAEAGRMARAEIERLKAEAAELRAAIPAREEELFRGLFRLYRKHDHIPAGGERVSFYRLMADTADLFKCSRILGDALADDLFVGEDGDHGRRDWRKRNSKSMRGMADLAEKGRI